MRNLFDIMPDNFFNLLSGHSNQELYAGCLMEIYRLFDREISYRMDRETIRQAAVEYIMEEHRVRTQEDIGSPKELANLVINRMVHAGWLEDETDSTTYVKYISFTESGLALAEFVQQMVRPEKEEYAAYIFQIYNALKHKEQWQEHPYVQGVKMIHRNARHMSMALKKLSTFMRTIIERMVQEQTLESLTENLLEYCEGEFIREYSRLARKQNIHLYRTAIREELDSMLEEEDFYRGMVLDCMEEEMMTEADAREQVSALILSARRFLTEDYDQIMYDIKQKLNIYIHLAIGRARFLMSHEETMRGNVEQTIKYLVQDMLRTGDDSPEEGLSGGFRLQNYEYIDCHSIRFPRRMKDMAKKVEAEVEPLTEEFIERTKQQLEIEAYNPYSRDKMKDYIQKMLDGREEISGRDLPLDSEKDLLTLLSAAVYAKQNGYELILGSGYHKTQKACIRDFVLRRQEDKHED